MLLDNVQMITAKQAARLLRIHPNSVRRLARRGRIKFHKVDYFVVYDRASVFEFKRSTASKSKFDPTR